MVASWLVARLPGGEVTGYRFTSKCPASLHVNMEKTKSYISKTKNCIFIQKGGLHFGG